MYPVISSALKKGAKASTRVLFGTVRNTSLVHGNDPVLIEREKKSLSKSRIQTSAPVDSAEGWNEFLATDSEVFVKADRNTGVSMADLQERTVTHMRSARQEDEELLDQDGTDGLPDHAEK